MAKLNKKQIRLIEESPFMMFSTSENNQPRTAVIIPSKVDESNIIISDVSMQKTNSNAKDNPKVFLCSYDKDMAKWVKIVGTAKYSNSGSLFEEIKAFETTRGVTPKGIINVKIMDIEEGEEE